MDSTILPVFLLIAAAAAVSVSMFLLGVLIGPSRTTPVKRMPYESGMNPVQDARRRFDVRYYLVAIVFLVFDVELLFLYPWAVASRHGEGVDAAVSAGWVSHRGFVFGEVMVFLGLLAVAFIYVWRRGAFRWR